MNALLFSKTPSVTVLDNRGLVVRDIAYCHHPDAPDVTSARITRHQYDVSGFLMHSADPRLHGTSRVNFSYLTDLTGGVLRTQGVDNLVGSSELEADGDGNVISMEEYYPYGGTALWTARSAVEAEYKTVRYSGRERDSTGLCYYGYRYYQPWAGRWLSADPAGTADGLNLFRMVRNNPPSGFDVQGLMWKAVASGAAAAATMGYEAYKHSASPKSVERTSSSSFGNDRIHALNVKHTEKQNNFSLMEKISKNLSGRGKALSDLSQGGCLHMNPSIIRRKILLH